MRDIDIEEMSQKVYNKLLKEGIVPVEISARHVHLRLEASDKIFGKNYKFEIIFR